MPQVDKTTFLPIVFWTFTLFISGYLVLSLSPLLTLFSSMKVGARRSNKVYTSAALVKSLNGSLLVFPLISL